MPRWRTITDAARESGVSRRTLERWLRQRLLTRYVISGDRRTYIDLDQIDELRKPTPKEPRAQQ